MPVQLELGDALGLAGALGLTDPPGLADAPDDCRPGEGYFASACFCS
jgi:hypothetical protein